jgi:hypothetical protein
MRGMPETSASTASEPVSQSRTSDRRQVPLVAPSSHDKTHLSCLLPATSRAPPEAETDPRPRPRTSPPRAPTPASAGTRPPASARPRTAAQPGHRAPRHWATAPPSRAPRRPNHTTDQPGIAHRATGPPGHPPNHAALPTTPPSQPRRPPNHAALPTTPTHSPPTQPSHTQPPPQPLQLRSHPPHQPYLHLHSLSPQSHPLPHLPRQIGTTRPTCHAYFPRQVPTRTQRSFTYMNTDQIPELLSGFALSGRSPRVSVVAATVGPGRRNEATRL